MTLFTIDVNVKFPGILPILQTFLTNQGTIMATLDEILANEQAEAAADAALNTKIDALILNGQTVLDALNALKAAGGLTAAQQAQIDSIAALQASALAAATAEGAKVDAAAAPLVP